MFNEKGFTILELMIAIVILGIIAAMASPSFARTIQSNRIATTGTELRGAVSLARTEAIKRASVVALCPTTDGQNCSDADNWSTGWMVFIDNASLDTTSDPEVGDVIRRWEYTEGEIAVSSIKDTDKTFSVIRFDAKGLLVKESQADSGKREFDISSSSCLSGEDLRKLVVGYAGLVYLEKSTCS